MIRKLLLGTVAGLTLSGVALAQVNVVPQVGVISAILKRLRTRRWPSRFLRRRRLRISRVLLGLPRKRSLSARL